MVTIVGKEVTIQALLYDLVQLDYDAIAAYDAAIERLDQAEYKRPLTEFRADHARHTQNLAPFLQQMGSVVPNRGNAKALLTTGKVILGNLFGDRAILEAMRTNEDDTNTAYGRAVVHPEATPEIRAVLEQNLSDERRHCSWILDALGKTQNP
jgi:rubrerythrin